MVFGVNALLDEKKQSFSRDKTQGKNPPKNRQMDGLSGWCDGGRRHQPEPPHPLGSPFLLQSGSLIKA